MIADLQKWIQLASSSIQNTDVQVLRALLRCTVIGGMAAIDEYQRSWFAVEVDLQRLAA
jgi:hypothetical protein